MCFSYELAISLQPYTAHHTHNTSSHNTKPIHSTYPYLHDKIFEGDILHFSRPYLLLLADHTCWVPGRRTAPAHSNTVKPVPTHTKCTTFVGRWCARHTQTHNILSYNILLGDLHFINNIMFSTLDIYKNHQPKKRD